VVGFEFAAAILITAVLTLSCEADRAAPYTPVDKGWPTVKDDVLHSLELSYNERNLQEYDKLLDDNFVMIFSATDVSEGVTPDQWGREKEVDVTRQMFDPNHPNPNLRITSIDCSLDYEPGDWEEETANPDHPDESWWRKTVTYYLIMKWDEVGWERRGIGLKAEIVIRWDPDRKDWRIVLFRDGADTPVAMAPGEGAVEESSWGRMKALYDDE